MAMLDKMGLSDPIHNPDDAKVDIVFIHGLGGDRELTWTHSTFGTFWPRDLLPHACPQARILTFGYNSNWASFFGLSKTERISFATIKDHSTALVGDLAALREKTSTNDRPIFFVTHSLGGIVCANALCAHPGNDVAYQNLIKSTRGVMFFGTPFEGADKARWASTIEAFLKVFAETNAKNLKALEKGSETLATINTNFAKFLMDRAKSQDERHVEVACFFEELSVKINGKSIGRVVSRESATIVGVEPVGIEADHRSMCKFEDDERRGYIRASEKLCSWIKGLEEEPLIDAKKYAVFQGNVTYGEIKSNHGVLTGNIYTPASNGVKVVGSYHYHGTDKKDRKKEKRDRTVGSN